MKKKEIFITNNAEETRNFGKSFAERLELGDLVIFYGNLGTGKTEIIKGICEYLRVEEIVNSPTFNIINQYIGYKNEIEFPIYHIDLYRIKEKKEFDEIGFVECIYSIDSIKLIEWADRYNGEFPDNKYIIKIESDDVEEDKRLITLS